MIFYVYIFTYQNLGRSVALVFSYLEKNARGYRENSHRTEFSQVCKVQVSHSGNVTFKAFF